MNRLLLATARVAGAMPGMNRLLLTTARVAGAMPGMKRLLLAAALVAGATPAVAQSLLPRGTYLRGEAQVEYLFAADPARDFQGADLSLGIDPTQSGFDLPLGFDLSVKGYRSGETGLGDAAVYAAIGFATDPATLWAGAPRPATGGYFPMPRVGGSLAGAPFAGTGITTTDTLALRRHEVPLGLRLDTSWKDLMLAASFHDFPDSDVTTLAGLLAWKGGPFSVALGAESADGEEASGTDLSGRVAYDATVWGFSAMYSTTSVINSRTVAFDAFYAPREDIRLTAAYARFDVESERDKLYGISAEYTFPSSAYLGVGITQSDIADLDASYNAFAGIRFAY